MTVRTCRKSLVWALASYILSFGTACTPAPAEQPGATTSGSGDDEPATATLAPEPGPIDPTTTTTTGTGATEPPTTGSSTTTGSKEPVCGDGWLDPGEECDNGPSNANTGVCTLECKHATCGDGLVWAGGEECDFGLGNSENYGGCHPETCEFGPRCGDGVLDAAHEVCDQGLLNGTGTSIGEFGPCSKSCRFHGRLVFVTSALYDGSLGGVSGADLKCRTLAAAAGLPNPFSFRAWLADGFEAPLTRLEQADLTDAPYLRLDGRMIAADLDELVTLGPRTGIALTEQGQMLFEEPVWTNTSAFGEAFSPANHCLGWTSNSGDLLARVGMNAIAVEEGPAWQTWLDERHWTSVLNVPCKEAFRLYCFDDGFVAEGED